MNLKEVQPQTSRKSMLTKLGPYELNRVYCGDSKILCLDIPNDSVDLIFTDPVYENVEDYSWLAKTSSRILKPKGHLIVYFQTNKVREVCNAIHDGGMCIVWMLSCYVRGGAHPRLAVGHVKQKHALLCLKQDTPMWQHHLVDTVETITVPSIKKTFHWQKSIAPAISWIGALTDRDSIVLDPFSGGGSTLVACKTVQCHFLGFDIANDAVALSNKQLSNTMVPIF